MDEKNIKIEEYRYDLPESKIARYPLPDRTSSKLLVYDNGSIVDDTFSNIASYLDSDNLLIFNNTKVVRARLQFRKESGAAIEIFCLEPATPYNYETAFSSTSSTEESATG